MAQKIQNRKGGPASGRTKIGGHLGARDFYEWEEKSKQPSYTAADSGIARLIENVVQWSLRGCGSQVCNTADH